MRGLSSYAKTIFTKERMQRIKISLSVYMDALRTLKCFKSTIPTRTIFFFFFLIIVDYMF